MPEALPSGIAWLVTDWVITCHQRLTASRLSSTFPRGALKGVFTLAA